MLARPLSLELLFFSLTRYTFYAALRESSLLQFVYKNFDIDSQRGVFRKLQPNGSSSLDASAFLTYTFEDQDEADEMYQSAYDSFPLFFSHPDIYTEESTNLNILIYGRSEGGNGDDETDLQRSAREEQEQEQDEQGEERWRLLGVRCPGTCLCVYICQVLVPGKSLLNASLRSAM